MKMILGSRMQARRDAAAGPTLASIRRDRELAPPGLKPLFDYIEANLFDEDFSVVAMMRACRIGDNSVSTRFRRQTSERPTKYVLYHRLNVVFELLKHPEPPICLVAEMVGFKSTNVLNNNFKKRFMMKPRAHRLAHAGAESDTAAEQDFSVIEMRQGLEGRLEPERGQALAQELLALYPPGGGDDEMAACGFSPAAAWARIRHLPPEERLAAIRAQSAAVGRARFEMLSDKSREQGRRNRRDGVEWAELALDSLEVSASALGDELPGLRALGWARLGNARRLALDFPAAEEAFKRAATEWHLPGTRLRAAAQAEILSRKAAFRAMQHRLPEAKELADQVLKLLEDGDEPVVLVKTLIVRARITGAEGELDASIADLRRAMELVDPGDGRLRLSICHNLATACMDAGRFADAAEILPAARDLCSAHGQPLERDQLRWVEGRVAKGLGRTALAEEHFLAAHTGFAAIGEASHGGMVALELALIYCRQGRPQAVSYAAEAIPILDGFKIRSEAVAARRLLAEAVARERVTPEILRKVRTVLSDLVRDPAVR